jgi:hypothetical protein
MHVTSHGLATRVVVGRELVVAEGVTKITVTPSAAHHSQDANTGCQSYDLASPINYR